MEAVERRQPEEQESELRALFRLADQLAIARGQSVVEEVPVLTVVEGGKARQRQQTNGGETIKFRKTGSGGVWISLVVMTFLVLGVGAGGVIGWLARDEYKPTVAKSGYRPASLSEAQRLLSGVGPSLGQGKLPAIPPATVPARFDTPSYSSRVDHAALGQDGKRDERPSGRRELARERLAPMGVSMPDGLPGNLPIGDLPSGGLPGVGATASEPGGSNSAEVRLDLHGLEAKARMAANDVGGRVVQSEESDSSRTLQIRVKRDMESALRSRLRHALGNEASISTGREDESATPSDDVKEAELKTAEDTVSALKVQLAKDEVSFLPEAPVLRSLRAQYADAVKHLGEVRREMHPNVVVKVQIG